MPLVEHRPVIVENEHAATLVGRYRFENFVVGSSNRFAWAAAMAVAEQPGAHYNPLFIYGPAGLGKTHLLHAVGQLALELYPGLAVRYITSERFLNDFIDSIRRKRVDDFKHRYRSTDVLLLDDVQFFEGKEQILEEFFHTFNSLYESGKQMVISSDRHPRNLVDSGGPPAKPIRVGAPDRHPTARRRNPPRDPPAERRVCSQAGAQGGPRVHRRCGLRQHP